MERPEMLYAITVGQTRQKYRDNIKSLVNILALAMCGSLEEIKEIAGEWAINRAMTEMIIQQEYIRECERDNWGWDRGVTDFSKQGSCILNCNENA